MSNQTKAIGAAGVVAAVAAFGAHDGGPILKLIGREESEAIQTIGRAATTVASVEMQAAGKVEAEMAAATVVEKGAQDASTKRSLTPKPAETKEKDSGIDLNAFNPGHVDTKNDDHGAENLATGATRTLKAALPTADGGAGAKENAQAVTGLFIAAEPRILRDVKLHRRDMTLEDVQTLIVAEVRKSIEADKKTSDAGVRFEVLTGKLNIDAKKTVSGVTITGGEVNIYKVVGAIAGPVFACRAFAGPKLEKCVGEAVAQASEAIRKEYQDAPKKDSDKG